MSRFEVWAPGRHQVDVMVVGPERDGRVQRCRRAWTGGGVRMSRRLAQGTRYFFSLDGGPGRPDPRSRWQPDGVDGASAVVDPGAFDWHDQDWRGHSLATAVLYEMHIGTFSQEGTFDGAIGHLGHLVACWAPTP